MSHESRVGNGRRCFNANDVEALKSDRKIAVLATLDREELPNLTLITTLEAKSDRRLMFGQFCEGRSKSNLRRNPRAGFAVLDASGSVRRGTASWAGETRCGEDYEAFNRKPMFRYNAYAGIHTVHYLDVVSFAGAETLALPRVFLGAALLAGARRLVSKGAPVQPALKPWAFRHINRIRGIKFAAFVAADGYPHVAAALPCAAASPSRLLFAATATLHELRSLKPGTPVAVLALNLDLESVLVRGRIVRAGWWCGRTLAALDVDWVYNSMPFKQGTIFPPRPLHVASKLEWRPRGRIATG